LLCVLQAREAADTLPEQVAALAAEVTAARARTDAAKQGAPPPNKRLRLLARYSSTLAPPAEAARRAAGAEAKLSGAAEFAALYAQRLGMAFLGDAAPGEWGVEFTQVDPADAGRPFRFALHVGDAAYTRARPPGLRIAQVAARAPIWPCWRARCSSYQILTRVLPCAVTACEPPLATAGALVAALNAAPRQGLPRFVAGMRAAFAQLARTGTDAAQLCA